MFFIKASEHAVAKKQFAYKLKANSGLFFNMVVVQIIALLLSFNGIMHMGTGTNHIHISMIVFSGDSIIVLTLFWMFVVSIYLATKPYRNLDFTFVSNRVSSNLSTMYFLGMMAVVGSVTVVTGGILLKVILYFVKGNQFTTFDYFIVAPNELVVSIVVTMLYLLLIGAWGYFFGMLVQVQKLFSVVLPAGLIGLFIYEMNNFSRVRAVDFYLTEGSFSVFLVKVLFTVGLLFASVLFMANQLEVRK